MVSADLECRRERDVNFRSSAGRFALERYRRIASNRGTKTSDAPAANLARIGTFEEEFDRFLRFAVVSPRSPPGSRCRVRAERDERLAFARNDGVNHRPTLPPLLLRRRLLRHHFSTSIFSRGRISS